MLHFIEEQQQQLFNVNNKIIKMQFHFWCFELRLILGISQVSKVKQANVTKIGVRIPQTLYWRCNKYS